MARRSQSGCGEGSAIWRCEISSTAY
jgi:hypothetical protein